jgi:hypothetical protein
VLAGEKPVIAAWLVLYGKKKTPLCVAVSQAPSLYPKLRLGEAVVTDAQTPLKVEIVTPSWGHGQPQETVLSLTHIHQPHHRALPC